MTFDLKYGSLHDAIEGAFGLDVGKSVYVSFGTDGFWHVTDWNGKTKDAIYICFPTLSENDPIWLESTL